MGGAVLDFVDLDTLHAENVTPGGHLGVNYASEMYDIQKRWIKDLREKPLFLKPVLSCRNKGPEWKEGLPPKIGSQVCSSVDDFADHIDANHARIVGSEPRTLVPPLLLLALCSLLAVACHASEALVEERIPHRRPQRGRFPGESA